MTKSRDIADSINRIDSSAADATAMTIDSSENVLVGKTSTGIANVGHQIQTNGLAQHVADGAISLQLNRKSSNGDIAQLRKDGTTVGALGVDSGGFYLDGEANHTGLIFGGGAIAPRLNGSSADNTVNLGISSQRFENLFLGGGVYLGGTGSANALDDYEEGTFTPGFAGMTFSTAQGVYTKIGRRVHCSGIISACTSGTASAVTAKLNGLPFTVSNNLSGTSLEDGGLFQYWADLGVTASVVTIAPDDSSTECFLYYADGSGSTTLTALQRTAVDTTNLSLRFSFTYIST